MRTLTIPTIFSAIDRFTAPIARMTTSVSAFAARTERDFRNAGRSAFSFGRSMVTAGALVLAPLGLMAKSAVEFEDKMADVGKTTGLSGKPLERFGEDILNMSKKTRTGIGDLEKIAEIGGQLGIVKTELKSFTGAADKFNIALGKDFSGGVEEAVSTVGKIKSLFQDTRALDISGAIMRTGSAINELGAVGAGTSANISDFTLRLGALPEALKPSVANTLALGTYLEELGIDAQIGAGGMTNFLLVAGKNINDFAKQMKVSSVSAKALLAQDPVEFAKKFATSFKGLAPDRLAKKFESLGLGSQETIKVIGALGSATGRLTELQNISSAAFQKGTSLQEEAAKKNATSAAQLAILKNNAEAASITLGTAFLPVINSIVQKVIPFVEKMSKWVSRNKELTVTILKVVAAVGLLALGIGGVSYAIGVYQKGVVIAKAVSVAFTGGLNYMKGALVASKLATVQLNGAFLLTPFGMVVAGLAAIAAASYLVYQAFNKQTDAQRINAEVTGRAMQNTTEQRLEIQKLFEILRHTSNTSQKYSETLAKIDAMSPGLVAKYNLQTGSLKQMAQAERELTRDVLNRAKVQARVDLLAEKAKQFEQNKLEGPGLLNKGVNLFGLNSAFDDEQEQLKKDMNILQKQIVTDEIRQSRKEPANPQKANQESLQKTVMAPFLGGEMKSNVEVTIAGAPAGSTATASSSSAWMPKVANTRGN
jgi:TP901 family phage tail tape measure protein